MAEKAVSFPPVGALFSESWQIFTKTWVKLFVATLLFWVAYALVSIIAFIIAIPAGIFAFVSEGGKNMAALGSSIILLGADGAIWIVLVVIFSLILAIAQIKIIAAEDKELSYGELIRFGASKTLPILGLSIVSSFLIVGGLSLFVIPAFIFSYLFVFSQYTLLFENTSILDSLRRSMVLASVHFGEVFVRFLVFFGIQMLFGIAYMVASTMVSAIFGLGAAASGDNTNLALGLLSGRTGLSFVLSIISVLWSWYTLAFMYVIYKQASAATPKTETRSLKAAFIIAAVGWIIGVFILIASIGFIAALSKNDAIKKAFQDGKSSTTKNSMLTQMEADSLARDTFAAINTSRAQAELVEMQEDQTLCGYAQRRLEQLTNFGRLDDYKGFNEDFVDAKISKAYFYNYSNVGEIDYAPLYSSTTGKQIATTYATYKKTNVVNNATYDGACVRATKDYLVIVGGKMVK